MNELFWTAANNSTERLHLRDGFAFWRSPYDQVTATQADVYCTIAAVLHASREGHAGRPEWAQHEYERVLLSPFNFTRFNDGVIQAALLRAAHPAELDYSVTVEDSRNMQGILGWFLENAGRQSGEASIEFLFAIATGKLRLHQRHLSELLRRIQPTSHPALPLLIQYIKDVTLAPSGTPRTPFGENETGAAGQPSRRKPRRSA